MLAILPARNAASRSADMRWPLRGFLVITLGLCLPLVAVGEEPATPEVALRVVPTEVSLTGQDARQQVVVVGVDGTDQTRAARYESLSPQVVQVSDQGLLRPTGDGTGLVVVHVEDLQVTVPVTVQRAGESLPPSFQNDVQPIMTVGGCNSGGCHGKQRGQGGFQLSLLGFDSNFDYEAIANESRGRRVFPAAAEFSLLVRKPIAAVPHGGGKRLDPDGPEYATLLRWIEAGLPRSQPDEPTLERIEVFPKERSLQPGEQQQLLVTAFFSDGSQRDVTTLAAYQSSESAVADANLQGLVQASTIPGEAAIMARFMEHITTCQVSIPHDEEMPAEVYAALPQHNFVDQLAWEKLAKLNLLPSEPAEPHRLLRRLYLDIIGRVPTADEARAWLDDPASLEQKQARLIDELLASDEYADHWANKWVDLLRPNPYRVGIKATLNFDDWIRQAFRENKPYNEFVRELISARGSTWRNGAVTMFRDRRDPDEITTMVSQLFLGTRLECAKCHHHPFEVWGQDDFYSFAAYFAQIGRKGTGLSPPISGSEEMIFTAEKGAVKHPLTGEVMKPRPLFGSAPDVSEVSDPREALAEWMTDGNNPLLEKTIANRIWADLMGRGLVEPVDDLRATNPATNGPLLAALGRELREHDFDLKHLIRTVCSSYVYGLSSLESENNAADTQNYSRYYRQRLRAEVLLDSVVQITGVREKFSAMPPDAAANEIWTHRIDSLFLDTFGRPDENQDPPCERTSDTSVVQALHLMNAPALHAKLTAENAWPGELVAGERPPAEIVDEIYLAVYSRYPQPQERATAVALFAADPAGKRLVAEDLLWALMNTPEFTFKN